MKRNWKGCLNLQCEKWKYEFTEVKQTCSDYKIVWMLSVQCEIEANIVLWFNTRLKQYKTSVFLKAQKIAKIEDKKLGNKKS